MILSLGLATSASFGAWSDLTTGMPLLEYFPAKDLGDGEAKWTTLEDKFGRLFVGGDGLQVFDGQSWRTFPIGDSYALRGLSFGDNGRLWAAANNEAGYFTEDSPGVFKYHSLLSHLPANERQPGDAWGCARIGRTVYFIFRYRLLRWDGISMQTQPFPGASRLFPIKAGEEHWFHHLETGLYRLTESGARLEIDAAALPRAGILGMARDQDGLLIASGIGLYRPGNPPRRISDDQASQYIKENRLISFTELPNGNYGISTYTGGTIIVSKMGETLRILETADGLPSRTVNSLRTDSSGHVWSATPNGIFNFEGSGHSSVFNSLNGLKGTITRLARRSDGTLWALGSEGTFQLEPASTSGAHFKRVFALVASYDDLLVTPAGEFLSRHGGVDFFDGSTVREILELTGNAVFHVVPAKHTSRTFYLSETNGLSSLTEQPDGTFAFQSLASPPDFIFGMHEDTRGRVWLGTSGKGGFIYDPSTRQLSPLKDPVSGTIISGRAFVMGTSRDIIIFNRAHTFRANADGTGLKELRGAPALDLYAVTPGFSDGEILVAFQQSHTGVPSQGLGVLTIGDSDEVRWRALDVPALSGIGSVNTMETTRENGRPVLWIGSGSGVLRLDYDAIPVVQKPATPFIQLDLPNAGRVVDTAGFTFPFKDHRLNFHLSTGSYTRSKNWLLQTRLGDAEWSAPVARRSFEFTNLSEGDYRFEVRTINPAGLTSEPAGFAFRILPPWYRSREAFLGYAAALLLAVFGFIRIRELQLRVRNRELEGLVNVRTAELVKANAAKDEFLAGISHEIRNPMNGVIGIAENFRTEGLDLENRRKFSLLRQCATHLSSLLEDILDFSKVQAGAIELDPKPFDLPELVESVAAITKADSEKYGIPIEVAVSPAVPRKLVGDARRIRQILINFVSNALKFSGRGQVSVTVWCKPAGAGQAEVVFAISDEGPGISSEEQARLFTRFERGAAAQKGRVPGTGLGLALCKGLAEKMGGRIWLESELGRGSCFYFSAPFRVVEIPAEAAPAPAAAPTVAATRTALVVDDQEYNRIVLDEHLQSMGFKVQVAQEGQAALDLAARHAFDVIFLDFNLPGLSGVDVARAIRSSSGPSAHALMLATTAFTTPEKRAQCLDAGMDAFLGKPVTRDRLGNALAGLLSAPSTPESAPVATPAPPVRKSDGPADRLGNMRLLARKKGVPLADELALYFSEMEAELAQLDAAIQAEDITEAGRVSHMLCGRCSFIFERDLEQAQRRIEAAVGAARWTEAREHRAEFGHQMAAARVRLASSAPAAPPA